MKFDAKNLKMDIKGLKEIIAMDTKALYTWLQTFLKANGYELVSDGDNYIIAKPIENASRLCLVAHIDTLRTPGKAVRLQMVDEYIFNKNGVLGADDRAGVFGILETIKYAEKKPFVIFTNHEERGGVGVKKLCKDDALAPFINDISLFVELDRQDANEYVYYSNSCPDAVKAFAEKYGYHEGYGTYSDVCDLTDQYEIAHLNLSIGYYNQHKINEYLSVLQMYDTIIRVIEMTDDVNIPCEKVEISYGWFYDNYISAYESRKSGKITKTMGGSTGSYWGWAKDTTAPKSGPVQSKSTEAVNVGQDSFYEIEDESEAFYTYQDNEETVVVDGMKYTKVEFESIWGRGAWDTYLAELGFIGGAIV